MKHFVLLALGLVLSSQAMAYTLGMELKDARCLGSISKVVCSTAGPYETWGYRATCQANYTVQAYGSSRLEIHTVTGKGGSNAEPDVLVNLFTLGISSLAADQFNAATSKARAKQDIQIAIDALQLLPRCTGK